MEFVACVCSVRVQRKSNRAMFRTSLVGVGAFCLLLGITCGQESAEFRELLFTVEPQDAVALRDKAVLFDCAVHLDQKIDRSSVTTVWFKDGLPFPANDHRTVLSNGSLLLDGRPEEGWYQCLVTCDSLGAIISRKARLQVAYLDKIFLEEPRDMSVYLGDMVMLPCLINGEPKPNVQWFKDEKEVDLQNLNFLLHPGDGILEIRSLQFPNYGRYKCKRTNGERSKYSATALLIQNTDVATYQGVAPQFVMPPKDKIAPEGSSVVFHCGANGRDRNGRRPKVSWLKDGVTIDLSQEDGRYSYVGESSLRVDSVEERDAGLYTCRAANLEDTVDASAQLTVQVPPKLRSRLKNTVVPKMADKELPCDLYASPRPTIQWYKNGVTIIPDDYIQIIDGHMLRIMGFSASDSAIYQCLANNEVGSVQVMAQLFMHATRTDIPMANTGVPSPPVDVTAVVTSLRFITLSWRQPNTSGLSDIIGYFVRWKENDSDRERELNTTSLEANIQHLKPSTKYSFHVYAFNANGISDAAPTIAIETQSEAQVPEAPSGLQAYPLSSTSISLTWNVPRANSAAAVTGYKLYYYDFGDSEAENEVTIAGATSYVLRELKKFHQYSFRVVAFNGIGLGSSTEEVVCRTYSDVPSTSPQNVTVEIQSATSILVRWEAPSEESQNGIITGYRIQFRAASEKAANVVVTDGSQVVHSLTDLKKGTEYNICIQAQTVNGTGPATSWLIADTLTHDLDETVVPGEPSSLQARPQTTSIIVSWTPPLEQDILIRGYILGYGIGVPDVFRQILDAKQRYYSIKGLVPSSEYVISLKAFNLLGEGKPIYETTITREETTPEPMTPIIPPVGLKAIVLSSSTIVLTWTDTTLGRNQRVTDKRYYTVRFTPRAPRKFRFNNSTDLNIHIDDLRPDTEYEFSVKIIKGRRQSTWSLSVFNKTKEASPATAPRDVTPVAVEQTPSWVSLSWQPPRQTNGQITGYLVFYTTDNSQKDRDWVVEGVLGDRLSVTIKDLSLETTYYFKVQARNSIGYGPMSPTVIFRTPRSDGTGGGQIDTPDDFGRPTKYHFREFSDVWFASTPSTQSSSVTFPATVLWISIGCIGGVTVVALIIVTTFFCRRKRNEGAHGVQNGYLPAAKDKPGSTKELKPPDLWFHNQMEMQSANKSDDADEKTSMMSTETQDQTTGHYDSRSAQRPKAAMIPVDQPPLPRDLYLPTMTSGQSQMMSGSNPVIVRPVYPRTQYMSNFMTGPRVNAGYLKQQLPPVDSLSSSVGDQSASQSDSMTTESESSFNLTAMPNPLPILGNLSSAKQSLSKSQNSDAKSFTTEDLTEDLANLEGLMKDLSAITQHQFEC